MAERDIAQAIQALSKELSTNPLGFTTSRPDSQEQHNVHARRQCSKRLVCRGDLASSSHIHIVDETGLNPCDALVQQWAALEFKLIVCFCAQFRATQQLSDCAVNDGLLDEEQMQDIVVECPEALHVDTPHCVCLVGLKKQSTHA